MLNLFAVADVQIFVRIGNGISSAGMRAHFLALSAYSCERTTTKSEALLLASVRNVQRTMYSLQSRQHALLARSLQEKPKVLPEPLHSRAFQHSLDNLKRELTGQSTDDPECIDEQWLSPPLLYVYRVL